MTPFAEAAQLVIQAGAMGNHADGDIEFIHQNKKTSHGKIFL